jgi:hypothetical protein
MMIRTNKIGGSSPSQPGVCGVINATDSALTTDLVVESNTFGCPAGHVFPGSGVNSIRAEHSVVQLH